MNSSIEKCAAPDIRSTPFGRRSAAAIWQKKWFPKLVDLL